MLDPYHLYIYYKEQPQPQTIHSSANDLPTSHSSPLPVLIEPERLKKNIPATGIELLFSEREKDNQSTRRKYRNVHVLHLLKMKEERSDIHDDNQRK